MPRRDGGVADRGRLGPLHYRGVHLLARRPEELLLAHARVRHADAAAATRPAHCIGGAEQVVLAALAAVARVAAALAAWQAVASSLARQAAGPRVAAQDDRAVHASVAGFAVTCSLRAVEPAPAAPRALGRPVPIGRVFTAGGAGSQPEAVNEGGSAPIRRALHIVAIPALPGRVARAGALAGVGGISNADAVPSALTLTTVCWNRAATACDEPTLAKEVEVARALVTRRQGRTTAKQREHAFRHACLFGRSLALSAPAKNQADMW